MHLAPIAALRPRLNPEFNVYATTMAEDAEHAMTGIVDALTLTDKGKLSVIVDWKSDVAPDADTIDHYRTQVGAYLDMTGADRGLIVMMTTGHVIEITK